MKVINKFLKEARSFEKKDSVKAIIEDNDGKILLLRRQEDTPGAGQWDLPGGAIEKGESKEDALKREVFEETNLKIDKIKKFGKVNLSIPETGIDSDMHIFTCECENTQVELKPATWEGSDRKTEHNEYRWVYCLDDIENIPMLDILKKQLVRFFK